MAEPFNVQYTLSQAFQGSPNTVTTVQAGSVGVSPAASSRTPPYVVVDATDPTQVHVGGAVQMNITIVDGVNTLYPVGLAVQNPGTRSLPSETVFPTATVNPGPPPSITLGDDADNDTRGTGYEFVVLFQDQNGWFGILDPKIMNDQ